MTNPIRSKDAARRRRDPHTILHDATRVHPPVVEHALPQDASGEKAHEEQAVLVVAQAALPFST
eukprot:1906301-Alexandrium_andersonii.AAC.1